MKIVSQLIKTNILNSRCLLIVRINLFETGALDIPQTKDWAVGGFRFSFLYFMLFINTLYQTAFPPFYILPNFMRFYAELKIDFLAFFIDIIVSE
jgi:hypothetical protein